MGRPRAPARAAGALPALPGDPDRLRQRRGQRRRDVPERQRRDTADARPGTAAVGRARRDPDRRRVRPPAAPSRPARGRRAQEREADGGGLARAAGRARARRAPAAVPGSRRAARCCGRSTGRTARTGRRGWRRRGGRQRRRAGRGPARRGARRGGRGGRSRAPRGRLRRDAGRAGQAGPAGCAGLQLLAARRRPLSRPGRRRGRAGGAAASAAESRPAGCGCSARSRPASSLDEVPQARRLPAVHVPRLTYETRLDLWRRELGEEGEALEPVLRDVARRFRFEAAQIRAVSGRVAPDRALDRERLVAACRSELEPDLGGLAEEVRPRFRREELVLPHKQSLQLDEIGRAMASLSEVHYEWGTGRAWDEAGLAVLFAGAPGTGKTMAAEVLAGELDLPLYRVDLSQVVNKYIGETEKNLRHVFDACEASDLIVLFDEADSLFGRRTQVRDAHDRYANLEVSYLLSRMERAKGITILATNRKEDLDGAFLRRLRYVVDFPLPGVDERRQIWVVAIPDGRGRLRLWTSPSWRSGSRSPAATSGRRCSTPAFRAPAAGRGAAPAADGARCSWRCGGSSTRRSGRSASSASVPTPTSCAASSRRSAEDERQAADRASGGPRAGRAPPRPGARSRASSAPPFGRRSRRSCAGGLRGLSAWPGWRRRWRRPGAAHRRRGPRPRSRVRWPTGWRGGRSGEPASEGRADRVRQRLPRARSPTSSCSSSTRRR